MGGAIPLRKALRTKLTPRLAWVMDSPTSWGPMASISLHLRTLCKRSLTIHRFGLEPWRARSRVVWPG